MLVAMPAEEPRREPKSGALPVAASATLQNAGFVVIPGLISVEQLEVVADVYDAEVQAAVGDDIRVGSTSTRVVDFVNRGPLFDPVYIYPPLLDAAVQIVGPSLKLSTLHGRTLRPGAAVLDIPCGRREFVQRLAFAWLYPHDRCVHARQWGYAIHPRLTPLG